MSRRSMSPFLLASVVGVLSLLAGPAAALAAVSPTDDAAAVAQAIMASPPQLTGAGWQQRPLNIDPSATATAFGTQPSATAFPTHGDSFAVLSSGNAWAADDPGGGYEVSGSGWDSDRGDSHDVTTLRLDVNVPSTANCLSVDFSFLSEEWPDYVGDYNDAFIAELDTNDWTASGTTVTAPHNFAFDADGDVVTINSGGSVALSAAAAAGTTYNGATPRMTASTPITPGLHAIYLSISDNGDWALDSAAFVDNLQLGAVADPATDCPAGANLAPPRFEQPSSTDAPSATGPEGSVLRTSGSFAGLPAAVLALSVAPNVGTLVANGDGSWEWSMFAADDLHLTGITVSAVGLGFDGSASFDAIATNVAPTVTLSEGNDADVDEGSAHTYRYAIADPGADTITSVVTSCGPGTKVAGSDAYTDAGGSFRCAFPDGPAGALVTVQATDDDGGVSPEAAQYVTVRNVAPSVSFEAAAAAFDEGPAQRTFSYTISDPGRDTVASVATGCGDDGVRVEGSPQHTDTGGSFACVFADGDAVSTVTATATDSDGLSAAADPHVVTIHNVAPQVTLVGGGARAVDEGPTERMFTYLISDPGRDSVTAVATSCGAAGEKVAGSDVNNDTQGKVRCVFVDGPASGDVTVTATDSDGATGPPATQSVTVKNVAPSVVLAQDDPLSVDESRSERTYRYAVSDPGVDTVSAVATSCGAAGEKVPGSDSHDDAGGSLRCVFAAGPADSKVSARATDSDGATGAEARQTVVVNDPPIAAEGVDVAGVETDELTRTVATFSDPTPYATAGEYAASIDWGDGSPRSEGTIRKTDAGDFTVTGTHAYARFGGYDVTVSVADVDNAANAATAHAAATIADAAIHVTGKPVTTPVAVSGAVATFTDDATPDAPANEFSATIDWGDGSPRTTGTVSRSDEGDAFRVTGAHTYASAGRYAATVVVTSAGGSTGTATADVVVYAFATASGGTFAISDARSAVGSHVTFWGSSWQSANPFLSGVTSGGAFRGYVDPPASLTPRCGDVWSGRTGGSAEAPATVPPYMAVVVTNAIEKSGSMVAGYVTKLVVVQTDPGYGVSGTGTVVAEVCAMSDVPSSPPSPPRR